MAQARQTSPRVAILGAGPIGLEALAYARALGWPVTLFEAQKPGAHVERWGFVPMFTTYGQSTTTLGRQILLREQPQRSEPDLSAHLRGREFREQYLLPLAESGLLKPSIQLDSRVLAVGRIGLQKSDPRETRAGLPPFRLLVRNSQGQERYETADVVLDATGVLGRPNFLGSGGLPALGELGARPQLSYWVEDVLGAKQAQYAGKTIAVIGSGTSAATVVIDCATLAETHQATWIIWLTQGAKTAPLPRIPGDPLKERDRLAAKANHLAARCDGNLEYHAQSQIEECSSLGPDKGFRLVAKVGGELKTWEVERVVACVGYRADLSLASELWVREPAGQPGTDEPGYFHLGIKSFHRDSAFQLTQGHEQIRQVFAQLAGQPKLNLYADLDRSLAPSPWSRWFAA